MATAAGPVEITLMRPGVAPAIAPKAAAGQAVGEKLKGAPLASAAETAARGEIHVKTSGLTFDQKSGVATTSQHVDFSMAQGAGSSMGATYDSQQGLLVLDRAVELTTRRGAETVQIHAQHAEFERDSQFAACARPRPTTRAGKRRPARQSSLPRGWFGGAAGCDERLHAGHGNRRPSGGAHRAHGVRRAQPAPARPPGGRGDDGLGEREAGRRRQMHGTAPTAELEFNAQGQLRHAHLERGVAMDSEELSEQAGQPQRLSRTGVRPLPTWSSAMRATGKSNWLRFMGPAAWW